MTSFIVTLQFRSGKCTRVLWRAYNGGAARNEAAAAHGAVYAVDSVEIEGPPRPVE